MVTWRLLKPFFMALIVACGLTLFGCDHQDDSGDQAVETTDEASATSPSSDDDSGDALEADDEEAILDPAVQVLGTSLYQVTVRPNDTLSKIVAARCGRPINLDLIHQVFLDNEGVPQADGDRLVSPNRIEIDWVLLVDCELRDDSPVRKPLDCLDGDRRAFGGQTEWNDDGSYFTITICVSDQGRAEYFGVNQRDDSIRLPVCSDDDGVFRAENQGWMYELAVTPDGADATIALTDDGGVERLNLGFVNVELKGTVDVPDCMPAPSVHVVQPAAVNHIEMRQNAPVGFPRDTPKSGCLGTSIEAIMIPAPPNILEPGAPVFVEQGRWLRFSLPEGTDDVTLVGGGLEFDVTPSFAFEGLQEFNLKMTDEHPVGTYQIEVVGQQSDLPSVIIEPSRVLIGGFDGEEDGVTDFVFYGVSPTDQVTIFHQVAVGCKSRWHRWADAGTIATNEDANSRLIVDAAAGHKGRYCIVISSDATPEQDCRAHRLFAVR